MLQNLEVKKLSKKIGFRTILSEINLLLEAGELAVFTGPNGAGKTTLIRLIAGLGSGDKGEILWDGKRYGPDNGKIGYMGHNHMLYEALTVEENMNFFSRMYDKYDSKNIERLLRKVDLYFYRYEQVGNLSRGMQQRLSLARLLVIDPWLMLYDEPFTGLDTEGQQLLRQIIQEKQQEERIQVLITHKTGLLDDFIYKEVKFCQGKLVEVIEGRAEL